MKNKINNMWRNANHGGEDYTTGQCLSCKEFYDYNSKSYKFCPNCGIELKKEFTKQKRKWWPTVNKRPFPNISIQYLRTITHENDTFGFSLRYKELNNPKYQWVPYSNLYMNPSYIGFYKSLDNVIKNVLNNYTNNPSEVKLIIKRYDGTEKEIYCSQFRRYLNKPYKPIPKPNYDGPIASGYSLKSFDVGYIFHAE